MFEQGWAGLACFYSHNNFYFV